MDNNHKHKWSRNEDIIVTLSYKSGLNLNLVQNLLPNISLNSIRCKYQNCKYLDGENYGLSNCSKQHTEIWNSLL